MDWVAHIFLRNVVATLVICGFWDWFLYFSPLAAKLHKYKINPVYPSMKQIKHDAGVTVSASCFAATIEVILCHCWATGRLSLVSSLSEAPVTNLVMALLLTHYRSVITLMLSHTHCNPGFRISISCTALCTLGRHPVFLTSGSSSTNRRELHEQSTESSCRPFPGSQPPPQVL